MPALFSAVTHQTRAVESTLVYCWASVTDGGLNEHFINVACLVRYHVSLNFVVGHYVIKPRVDRVLQNVTRYFVMQNEKAVSAYFQSKEILPFGFAEQYF